MKITDKMRLDFVRQHGVGWHNSVMESGFFWPSSNCTRYAGQSFRQAIDAAIRSSSKGRRTK